MACLVVVVWSVMRNGRGTIVYVEAENGSTEGIMSNG